MQIWKGKAWQIWSHAVRQSTDTWGAVPNEESWSYTISLTAGGQGVSKAASIPIVVYNVRDVINMKWQLLLWGNAPHVSSVYLM